MEARTKPMRDQFALSATIRFYPKPSINRRLLSKNSKLPLRQEFLQLYTTLNPKNLPRKNSTSSTTTNGAGLKRKNLAITMMTMRIHPTRL